MRSGTLRSVAPRVRAASAAALLIAVGGCVDKRLTVADATSRPATLRLTVASLTAETRSVRVGIRYDRQSGERVALTEQTFDVTTASTPQLTLMIDLAPCLADAAHAGGSSACRLRAAISLRTSAFVLLDSVEVGPVTASPGAAIAPTSVSLAVVATVAIAGVPTATPKIGDAFSLTALLKDGSGNAITGRSVQWSSSNPAIATVDGVGKVKAVSAGTTIISAQSGNSEASVSVTVRALRVDFVRITPLEVLARFGVPQQLTARAVGDSGVVATIAWSSLDDAVVKVDAQGVLRVVFDDFRGPAVVCATATVTATGDRTTGCSAVRVLAPVAQTLALPSGGTVSVPVPIEDSTLAFVGFVDGATKAPVDLAMLDSGRALEVEGYRTTTANAGAFSLGTSDTTIIAADPGGLRLRIKRRSTSPVLVCASASGLPGKACQTVVVQGPSPLRMEALPSFARGPVGDSGQLRLMVRTPSGTSSAVTFRSSDPSKVGVSSTGMVSLHAVTKATAVCARLVADTTRAACATVEVVPAISAVNVLPYREAAMTKLIVQRSVLAGSTTYWKGIVAGSEGIDTRMRWSSSDQTQMQIDAATGVSLALKPSVTTIICGWPVADWTWSVCMAVYARVPSVTSAIVAPSRVVMLVGESQNTGLIFDEDPPASATVTWSSHDPAAVSVASTGAATASLTALKATPAAVVCATVAKAGAQSYRDCVSVRVVNFPVASSGFLRDTLVALRFLTDGSVGGPVSELGGLNIGAKYFIHWYYRVPATATLSFAYRSSDPTAAVIVDDGAVMPLRLGTYPVVCAEITANALKHDCVTLSINGFGEVRVRVAPSYAVLAVGDKVNMVASVDALRGESQIVQWSSGDGSKVSVSSSGVVTALAPTTGTQVCATVSAAPTRRACATVVVR